MTWFQNLVNTNVGRTISHAALAFAAVELPMLTFTSVPAFEASIIAALPAAAAALFRTLFPNIPS